MTASLSYRPRTVEACNYLCLQANKTHPFQYFGVQMGGTGCFCGDSYGTFGKVLYGTFPPAYLEKREREKSILMEVLWTPLSALTERGLCTKAQ